MSDALAGLHGLLEQLPAWMAAGEVPGVSLATAQDGALGERAALGLADAATGRPMTVETVFEAASLSKPVFAWLVLLLAQEQRFSLDQPVADLLPTPSRDFPFLREALVDPADPRLALITPRMLLSHSSGFGNGENQNEDRINFEPGSRFLYSSQGLIYLQRAIEHLTGTPLADLLRDRVLAPLGMNSSSYVWQERFAPQFATGHGNRPGLLGPFTEAWSGWSLYSTPSDLARYCLAMLRPEPGAGLASSWRDAMLVPQIGIFGPLSWGLGWGLVDTAHGQCFWQWGDLYTYQHYVIGCPAERWALVLMTNSSSGLALNARIVSALLGEDCARPLRTILALGW